MTTYKPPQDAAALFARYKEHYEGERELKPAMVEMADRELKAGATVGELARLTGLTPEVFRRRARALGVERKRPPTVGKLAPEKIAELRPVGPRPDPESAPAAAGRWQGSPSPRPGRPPAHLHLSPEVAALSEERARQLAGQAEGRHPDWGRGVRRELRGIDPEWTKYAVVEAAVQAGYVDLPAAPAGPDPGEQP